jgi:hypothetical protein
MMLLLPAPTNSAAELKLKLHTLVASKLKVHFDAIGIVVIIGDERKTRAKRRTGKTKHQSHALDATRDEDLLHHP